MSEKELLKILDIFMKYVRLDDEVSAKQEFKKILIANPKVTKNRTDKIYDVGEIFRYIEPHQYIVVINAFLNKQESYILRLLRQEIMYNSELYEIQKNLLKNSRNLEPIKTFMKL